MSTLSCRFCSQANPEAAKFCNACGSPLNLKPCPKCEAITDVLAPDCHQCGWAFGAQAISEEGPRSSSGASEAPQSSSSAPEAALVESVAAEYRQHVPESLAQSLAASTRASLPVSNGSVFPRALAVAALLAIGTAGYYAYVRYAPDAESRAEIAVESKGSVERELPSTPATTELQDRATAPKPRGGDMTTRAAGVPATASAQPTPAKSERPSLNASVPATAPPVPARGASTSRQADAMATQRLTEREMAGFVTPPSRPATEATGRDAIETRRLITRDLGSFVSPNANNRSNDPSSAAN